MTFSRSIAIAAALVAVAPAPLAAQTPAHAGIGTASPATLEAEKGTSLKRVRLSEHAAQRLDIQIGAIRQSDDGTLVTPYASVLYDLTGATWVYVNPEPLIYVRRGVVIASVKGADAVLRQGPPAGTRVVIVGVSELYGTEMGVGH